MTRRKTLGVLSAISEFRDKQWTWKRNPTRRTRSTSLAQRKYKNRNFLSSRSIEGSKNEIINIIAYTHVIYFRTNDTRQFAHQIRFLSTCQSINRRVYYNILYYSYRIRNKRRSNVVFKFVINAVQLTILYYICAYRTIEMSRVNKTPYKEFSVGFFDSKLYDHPV